MNCLRADAVWLERLASIIEPVEICDASGKVLGHYTPVPSREQEEHYARAAEFSIGRRPSEPWPASMVRDGRSGKFLNGWRRENLLNGIHGCVARHCAQPLGRHLQAGNRLAGCFSQTANRIDQTLRFDAERKGRTFQGKRLLVKLLLDRGLSCSP